MYLPFRLTYDSIVRVLIALRSCKHKSGAAIVKITFDPLCMTLAVVVCLSMSALRSDAGPMRRNVLSEEEVAALRTEVPGSREGETVQFTATFGPQTQISRRDLRRHIQAGSVPFRITADFVQMRMANNRPLRQRLPGTVHLYVQDAEGNVVVNESLQVERMCPT